MPPEEFKTGLKITARFGASIGSQATDDEIFFVVPMSANSLETIYFTTVDRTRAQDFILAAEWAHKTRPVPGV